ncbi:tRNA (cytidine(32)/guanosine(34)-2'-O)-methyltransferase [Penicillium angulare]|uniref:tRNA (cytidine(32)/guanosine(34)-2'-O)-methyltransferase n=1 Tax=Penicillium angulare TaxID=116970 RepID=UPI0025415D3D|nr:tRNA (cytidine(32)/guanosine(34)-2'-O)-methyltransferase [Penicillium angulare]KAJ5273756.1 tRNA (cytidine(32)/guanosine(34)-2'-O)-methyltransferase [Penicillium angulare]
MGKSSKDKRDAYYRLAKEQNWRARSAFKLIQIDEQFDLFEHENPEKVTRVVDLCAAPGSWSQVLSRVLIKGESFGRRAWLEKKQKEQQALQRGANQTSSDDNDIEGHYEIGECDPSAELQPRKNVKIVSIDLQPMAPLEGITTLKADITHPSTIPLLLRALDPEAYESSSISNSPSNTPAPIKQPHPVDLVISDGAPDVTGLHDLDIYIQSQLLYAALNLAIGVLRPGGKFVAKIFRARDVDLLYAQLRTVFERVSVAKPRSSRASSLEAFIVCEGFIPPTNGDGVGGMASLKNPLFGGAAIPKPVSADGNLAVEVRDDDENTHPQRILTQTVDHGSDSNHPTYTSHLHPSTCSMDPPSAQKAPSKFADEHRWIPSFIACGDLSAWDSDASYTLPPDYVHLDPVQPPTAPPYRKALEFKQQMAGIHGKTKNFQSTKA